MNLLQAAAVTERDLINALISAFFIVDYGYINKVNPDGTVNVTHAIKPVLQNGQELNETTTDNVEVLTISGAGFSLKWDYRAKDRVLLFGLKDYVGAVSEVESAKTPDSFFHYSRNCLKALPLCLFDENAAVRFSVEEGALKIETEAESEITAGGKNAINGETVTLNGDDNGGLVITPELSKQLQIMTARIDGIMNALKNAPTASQDGGAAYKAGIVAALNAITQKEDFGAIESDKVFHGTGA